MPRKPRIIVTDGSVVVHEAPRRRRREPAAPKQESVAAVESAQYELAEPSVATAPEAQWEAAAGETDLAAELSVAVETEAGFEVEAGVEAAAVAEPEFETEPSPEPEASAEPPEEPEQPGPLLLEHAAPRPRTVTRSRSNPAGPPPGWAVEFGTGRLVPLHSFKGRMTFPSSDS